MSTPDIDTLAATAAALRERVDVLHGYVDPEKLRARVDELETAMQADDFWDDPQSASRVSAEHAAVRDRLEEINGIGQEVADLVDLVDVARGEGDDADGEFLAEIDDGLSRIAATLERLEEARLFSGEHDGGDAIVSINAGEGGTDAQDWAEMLLRMYLRWAEARGFTSDIKEQQEGTEAGLKSVTFTVSGASAYGLLSAERGVHRLVRLSPFDSAHRRQTSFAAVDVGPLVSDDVEVEIEDKDLRIDTYRASGAGGQHVNKTESAIRITHLPTGIVVQCQNERSQTQNRATAMSMLRSRLVQHELQIREEEAARARGESMTIGFGSQIRSYVIHPYTMVKDLRTGHEVGNAQSVLDGDLDAFIRAELERRAQAAAG
ncbi:MAG: peptide chain release factor 2 [Actinobacteria bacterium]|nr:peptide chain release factor 2 [Dehalococcoidia bacterium]MCB0873362.1 peptide chain release factor 2 [Thermoleophilia bacterium]MCB9010552.1 peptide chain release factor 2 [Actinomycetota bacterium]